MTSSLVGSEMCIRDRFCQVAVTIRWSIQISAKSPRPSRCPSMPFSFSAIFSFNMSRTSRMLSLLPPSTKSSPCLKQRTL
eukprot:12483920-Prorocentrum_lima.AAC.1